MAMTKKEQAQFDSAMVMASTSEANEARAIKAEKALDDTKDNRPFALKITRSDGQSNNRTIIGMIDGKVFHAQCVYRNKNEFISTEQFITGHNEALKRTDVQEFLAEKERCDLLATQKNVASQGDVPSAS